ncbi:MAG: endonuclease/exonuclease/phosphatase family protein [Pseudomonadota bacterium]
MSDQTVRAIDAAQAPAVVTATTARLPNVPPALRARIEAALRTSEAHRALFRDMRAMHLLEHGGSAPAQRLPARFTAVAWNAERCVFQAESEALLAAQGADIILLSEVDCGMARTGQRHTSRLIAEALEMAYAFGVEFHELGLGEGPELAFCKDDHNVSGWHGNALLSRVPPTRTALIRLDDHGHWFTMQGSGEPRLGGRMAVAAMLPWECGEICAVSVHLESHADPRHRSIQMERLLAAIDGFAGDAPVIIGGDLNTGVRVEGADWRKEGLFGTAETAGYSWHANADGTTTRPSRLTLNPTSRFKLDWFALRGLLGEAPAIVPALDPAGQPLSDHELVRTTIGAA